MPLSTVQCSFASYDAKIVVVEAETIDEALDRAITAANEVMAGCRCRSRRALPSVASRHLSPSPSQAAWCKMCASKAVKPASISAITTQTARTLVIPTF